MYLPLGYRMMYESLQTTSTITYNPKYDQNFCNRIHRCNLLSLN